MSILKNHVNQQATVPNNRPWQSIDHHANPHKPHQQTIMSTLKNHVNQLCQPTDHHASLQKPCQASEIISNKRPSCQPSETMPTNRSSCQPTKSTATPTNRPSESQNKFQQCRTSHSSVGNYTLSGHTPVDHRFVRSYWLNHSSLSLTWL